MRAVSDNAVAKNNSAFRILSIRNNALSAEAGVDHRVRTAYGEFVITEIKERMFLARTGARVLQLILGMQRNVGIDMTEFVDHQFHRFIAQCSAGIESADIFLCFCHLAGNLFRHGLGFVIAHREIDIILQRLAAYQCNRLMRSVFEGFRGDKAFCLDLFRIAADEFNNDRLPRILGDVKNHGGNLRSRGLRNERDDFCVRIVDQCVKSEFHHQTADVLLQITAAGSDNLGNTFSQLSNNRADFLGSCTGSTDHTDLALRDDIRERQRNIIDNRRAAVRSHDKKFMCVGIFF